MKKFKYGDKVRITGNKQYCTHNLDGQIGMIVNNEPDSGFYIVQAGMGNFKYFIPGDDLTLVDNYAE